MTAALPNRLPRPDGELAALQRAWQPPRGWRILSSVNNIHIGLFYIGTSLLFFVLAGALALIMRAQLAVPGAALVDASTYNQLFTMHGTVMMFLFAVPVVEAVAVYLLPGMLGARDLPFPRLSAYAFWAYAIGGTAFFATLFFDAAPDGGWFMYPPLTSKEHSPGIGADFWLLGIGFIEISAIAGAIELIIGVLFTRAPGMSLMRMPIYAWAMLVVGLMIVFAFPAVIAGTALLELERAFDWPFFIPARGGDPLLWQHLFWFFGHPEVYILFLPAAGLVSMMLPVQAGTAMIGYRAVVIALVGVGVLSFALWAHHMFTAGLGVLTMTLVSAASLAVAIPTGVQVFGWIATLWRGRLRGNAVGLFLLGFLFIFVLGGLTGVMVAILPFDWQVHDSYFIVAHLHYVLVGGLVFPLFAALYHWSPLLNGHRLSERAGRWAFALLFGGFNLAFFPMHVSGLLGMPRRVFSYDAGLGWSIWNLLSTAGAFVFAAGVAVFAIDAWRTWRRPAREHGDPWRAATLEWLPNGDYGIRSIPGIAERDPLWHRPTLGSEVAAGAHWLPGTALGGRETLLTTPRRATISHLVLLPGDSWLPLAGAAGTAGFFLLLTVGWFVTAVFCGLVAVAAVIAWLWQSDRVPVRGEAVIGDAARIPVGGARRHSHSWWGTVILIIVDASIAASFGFAHLHLAMQSEVCPPAGARLPAIGSVAAAVAAWLLAAGLTGRIRRLALVSPSRTASGRPERGASRLAIALIVLAAGLTVAGSVASLAGHQEAGLTPTANGWSATVGALVGYQTLHAIVVTVMAIYLAARIASGLLAPRARATLENIVLFWRYSAGLGVVTVLAVQLLPALMGWFA
ncbi:MAG: cbb3-type cytochrome c oxidase subunit I [Lautropia sp.]